MAVRVNLPGRCHQAGCVQRLGRACLLHAVLIPSQVRPPRWTLVSTELTRKTPLRRGFLRSTQSGVANRSNRGDRHVRNHRQFQQKPWLAKDHQSFRRRHPGAFWSPLLACTEFFGGIFIAIGLLTRPAAFAGLFVLLVTVWFHWVTVGQGFSGAEKSLLWAAILLFFVIRGGNRHSVDARIGKAF